MNTFNEADPAYVGEVERRVQRIMARSDFIGTFLSLSGCGQTAPEPRSLLTGEGR